MTTFCLAAAMIVADQAPTQQAQQSLLEQIVGAPTGRNGYEEYLMAGELTRSQLFSDDLKATVENKNGTPGWLASKERFASDFGRIKDLIALGNAKDVFDPRSSVVSTTLYPELMCFKNTAKLLPELATVQFSRGQNQAGAETLDAALTFAEKMSNKGTLIAYLVGSACRVIACYGYQTNMERIPLASWKRVVTRCGDDLKSVSFKDCVRRDIDSLGQELASAFESPDKLERVLGNMGPDAKVTLEITRLPLAARQKLAAVYAGRLDQVRAIVNTVADAPEVTWHARIHDLDQLAASERDPNVRMLLELTTPVLSQCFVSELKRRTQARLLRAHALIQSYRWERGQLPATLADLEAGDLVVDPTTQAPFNYTVTGLDYELYSTGIPEIGRLDLVFKAPKDTRTFDGPIPP